MKFTSKFWLFRCIKNKPFSFKIERPDAREQEKVKQLREKGKKKFGN